ncbi:rhomboid family intramembrane serine protease [Gracilibacillus xinjiangensis]|uniref:Rhomboid family intramembrane serine protease n=1 Tax=Gracilibacillus xinjiangensis TaxID=1193282 RepID=A0ABV8WYX6_9BACI
MMKWRRLVFYLYIKKQYQQNKFVLQLMEKDFEIISTNRSQDQYLLERRKNSKIEVVHVSLTQHDWKRALEQHIHKVEKKYSELQRNLLSRKKYHFYHIFVVDYPPVDEWIELQKNRDKISIFIVDEPNEWLKIKSQFQLEELDNITEPNSPLELEQSVYNLKRLVLMKFQEEQENRKKLFEQGKPFWTNLLLAVNVIMYVLLEFYGGSTSVDTLISFGAKYNLAIVNGEWWRIITSMFLHIGLPHILLNMMALYFIGSLVERIFGNIRFLTIYFLAGIVGGFASFAFNNSIAAGASGAIFGLFGALLFFGSQFPKDFFRTIGWNVIFVISLNIIFGFSVGQIDNAAHLGGLVGGFIASGAVMFRHNKRRKVRIISTFVLLILIISLGVFGYNNEANHYNEAVQLQEVQQLLNRENYQEIIYVTSDIIPYADKWKPELYFYRSFAHIQLDHYQEAISDLEMCLKLDPNLEKALYNLAILYQNDNRPSDALLLIEKALEIDPDNSSYQTLYEQLEQKNRL